eukprot:Gb_26066 [translate_table: standard]
MDAKTPLQLKLFKQCGRPRVEPSDLQKERNIFPRSAPAPVSTGSFVGSVTMFCAISGVTPEEPVISKLSGLLFEKRLIEKYIAEHGKCPISGEPLSTDDLIPVQTNKAVKPRPLQAASIPGMLALFQNYNSFFGICIVLWLYFRRLYAPDFHFTALSSSSVKRDGEKGKVLHASQMENPDSVEIPMWT